MHIFSKPSNNEKIRGNHGIGNGFSCNLENQKKNNEFIVRYYNGKLINGSICCSLLILKITIHVLLDLRKNELQSQEFAKFSSLLHFLNISSATNKFSIHEYPGHLENMIET